MMESDDQYFLLQAAKTNLKEIEMGTLAQTKGNSEAVKSFGRKMVEDHTKAFAEVQELAGQTGVAIPTTVDDQSMNELNALSALTGNAFDQKFALMMVDGHQKAITLMENAARDAQTDRIKQWASAKLPVLRSHLEHAQMLQKNTVKK